MWNFFLENKMGIFLNVIYKKENAIVKIQCQNNSATAEEIYRDVKNHFKINGVIDFKYQTNLATIHFDILEEYVEQYRRTPGWGLEAIEVDVEQAQIIENRTLELEFNELIEENKIELVYETQTENIEPLSIQPEPCVEEFEICFSNETFKSKISSLITIDILKNLDDLDFKLIIRDHSLSLLENCERTKLSKIIIKYILQKDVNIELNRYDFLFLAELIKQVFPQEPKEIYYSVAKFGQKAAGKLYDAYNNYRKKLSQSGFLKRRAYISKTINSTVIIEDSNDLTFVKTSTISNQEFLEKWKNCLPERQQILQISELTTYEFLKQFQIFNNNNNVLFEVLKLDVFSLYPSFCGIESWDGFYKNVFIKLNMIKDSTAQKLLKSSETLNEASKKSVALLLLPYMFPSTILKSQKKKNFKASKIEIQEKFIVHHDTLQQADCYERLSIEEKINLQPKIIFVGKLEELKAYVTQCDKLYFFENPLEAVEACFCIFMGLNVQYPMETKVIWNFVQRYIFKISTQFDLNNTSIKTVFYKLNN